MISTLLKSSEFRNVKGRKFKFRKNLLTLLCLQESEKSLHLNLLLISLLKTGNSGGYFKHLKMLQCESMLKKIFFL